MSNSDIGNIKEIFVARKDKKENDIVELQQRVLKKYIDLRIDEIEESFKILCDEFDAIFNENGYILMNKNSYYFYYVHKISSILPNKLSHFKLYSQNDSDSSVNQEESISFEEFMENSPNEDDIRRFLEYNKVQTHQIDSGSTSNILFVLLKNKFRPKTFKNNSTKSICELLNVLYKKNNDWFTVSENSIIFKNKDDVKKYFYDNAEKQEFYFLPEIENIINGDKIEADDEFIENFKQELLECEFYRCNLPNIFAGTLSEIGLGHWDLFDYNDLRKDDCIKIVTLPKDKTIYFRDPHIDCNDSQVAIDFGTKSTVVAYKDRKGGFITIKLTSSRDQELDKNKDLYENPTIMHFKNFKSFSEAYNERAGRPNTKWVDLTVAHEAVGEFEQSKFEEYFIDLKSWCASKKKNKIKDKEGKEQEFPPFLELSKLINEPNPVEYYAYFLGLYINNMSVTKNIFTDYKMSFPITFPEELRKAIRASFEKGIRKSFPTSLLSDEAFKKKFTIKEGLREPVAYAITALEKYHFDDRARNGESCCYAVFDFGGGTTDFDFGVYSKIDENDPEDPDNDFDDYKIIRLGEGGDSNLGGEKLLKYLAFEVLKNNVNKIFDEDRIRVALTPYDGCFKQEYSNIEEFVIPDSSNAKRNMSILMELLRWVWEEPDSSEKRIQDMQDSINSRGCIEGVELLDESGQKVYKDLQLLKYDYEGNEVRINLQKLLRDKIEKGIKEFFKSLVAKFKKSPLKDIDEISIFLAGNSTKSKLFNKILSEYLGNDYEYDYVENDNSNYSDEPLNEDSISNSLCEKIELVAKIKEELGNPNLKFVVYPPLKTKEAKEKLQEMGYEDLDLSDPTEPSGKTGVAYGMLVERVRIDELKKVDVAFQYYVGVERDKKLAKIALEQGSDFGKWNKLCVVGSKRSNYTFYYTKSDEAINKNMSIDKMSHDSIPVDCPQDRTAIFICALEPNVIQWQVADSIENLQDLDENVNRITLGE